jgi:DNA-binding response OmpR family regulator
MRQPQSSVLIVDDNPDLLENYRLLVGCSGYRPLTARTAAEGLALFERDQARIRLVLTDGELPGGGGLWLARNLRKRSSQVPVVLASGFLERFDTPECRSLFTLRFTKPMPPKTFQLLFRFYLS